MAEQTTARRVLRFGTYQVDFAAGELRKNGGRIKLQSQPFQILCLLLERPGELITREELRQKLWPDGTFVDFEHSLNTAVKKLREALRDDADNPRFIETVPRRGYKFIAPVNGFPSWVKIGSEDAGSHARPRAPMLGRVISHYRIEEKFGEGGRGVVYRATDLSLNRSVAIKFLSSEVADEQHRRRFQQEAQTASSLNHPHILTVFEAGTIDGQQYLVTEFIDGCTLREWARRTQPSTNQIVKLMIGIADALATAHQAGILHRDVKPENILVAKSGYAKLVDFGLAKLLPEASAPDQETVSVGPTRGGAILGTVAYMSPEQATARPVDARSDIFSFAIVLYELSAGQRPFQGGSNVDLLHAIVHREPEPLADARLAPIVEKALEKDPAERYQSMREMVVDLKRLQRPNSVEPLAERVPAQPHRHRWGLLAGATAGILAVAAGVSWQLWQRDYFWEDPLADARVERLADFEGDEVGAAISPDGKLTAFMSDRAGDLDLWVGQIGSGDFVKVTKGQPKLGWNTTLRWLGFSGDGAQVWFTFQASPQPPRFASWLAPSMGSGAPHVFLETGMEPAWSPDGSRIAYHTADPGDPIFLAERTGRDPKQIFVDEPSGLVHAHFPTWSPDGRFVYFVRGVLATEETDIWRIPSGGGAPERITYHNARVSSPAWLDSRTLLYSATAEDGSGQWLYAIDVEHRIPHRVSSGINEQYLSVAVSNTRPRRLVATVAMSSTSLWAVPLSDRIQTEESVSRFPVPNTRALGLRFGPGYFLFLSSKGGGDGIWKLEKGAARELWKGSDGGVVAPPAISPDGAQICFSYRKSGRVGLYLMSADGTNIRTLTESVDVRGAASWSPDGKWIAIAGNQGEGIRMFKVPVNGGPPVRLVSTFSFHPLWSPDGRFILYSEPRQGATFQVKAVTADGAPFPLPELRISQIGLNPYRFLPNRRELLFLRGQTFYSMNLDSGQQRQLTDWKTGSRIYSFDVSAEGKQIVFDRVRESSDIVLIDLKR